MVLRNDVLSIFYLFILLFNNQLNDVKLNGIDEN